MDEKIQDFTQLKIWQKGHRIVLEIYKISEEFPKSEIFGISSQMRRCAVSITSNIAEGFGRRSKNEKRNFYNIGLGSISELQNQLLIVRDLKYVAKDKSDDLSADLTEIQKMIHGLIKRITDS